MNRVVFSPKAKTDLNEIWEYTLAEWGVEQAEKYVRELWSALNELVNDPKMSANIDDVRKGYRKVKSGSHIIFFKMSNDVIDVIRILHQGMDFERHLS